MWFIKSPTNAKLEPARLFHFGTQEVTEGLIRGNLFCVNMMCVCVQNAQNILPQPEGYFFPPVISILNG